MVDSIPTNRSPHQVWRAYSNFPGYGDYPRWTSEAIERALDQYQNQVGFYSRNLVIPEDWKTLLEDTDTLSAILCKSLKRYFDHLSFLSEYWDYSYLTYANTTKIEKLAFPKAQIIPNTLDPLKYYTNLSRALLHIFSYPGITTCRCEMDAERNISLLLFTLFDWFGVFQPGSSKHNIIDSIRVFKRNSQPQWTKDGLVPIVLFPQRLHPIGEQRKAAQALKSYRVKDNRVPDILMPLLVAVEPTLTLLLDRVIVDWKETRKTSNEEFALPEWLFIHGIVYDALQIDFYTFMPKILECDDNGGPSKWEFICIPTGPFEFNLFDTRHVLSRARYAAVLLAIQRQTKRICLALDGLSLSTIPRNNFPLDILGDLKHGEHEQCTNDEIDGTIADKQNEAASQSLLDCIRRTGLNLLPQGCTSNNWFFFESLSYMQVLGPQKDFILNFINNWQSRSGKIPLPEDWLTATFVMKKYQSFLDSCDLFQTLPKLILQTWVSHRKENFIPLTAEELRTRHFDSQSFCPDFYLSTPARKERSNVYDKISLNNLHPTIHSLEHFKDVFQYISHELDAKMAISSPFMCTPGCWLKYDTESRFPTALSTDSSPVDFSLLLHPIQTVPIEMTPLTPDVNLRATILNPALVVGIQGPIAWPEELACSPASSRLRPKNKSEALRQLAKAIEPSLKTHLINWQLRFEQGLVPTKDLPSWFMLFGLIYDAEEVNIVAHVPYMNENSQYSFISCIVDTISFPPVNGSSKVTDSWFLDRFRVGLALLSLQKHAFHMAGLWECVTWPNELISWEEILEREYLGPVLTPSERGYMVEPHPMSELYREMHGSDETLDEYSGTVSEDGEDSGDNYAEDGRDDGEKTERSSDDDDNDSLVIEEVKRLDYLRTWLQQLKNFKLVDPRDINPENLRWD